MGGRIKQKKVEWEDALDISIPLTKIVDGVAGISAGRYQFTGRLMVIEWDGQITLSIMKNGCCTIRMTFL